MTDSVSASSRTLRAMSPELAGLAEVAEIFGVTKRTAWNYTQRDDFPEPVDRLASGPIWRRADIERWQEEHRPPLPPGRPPAGD
jgi:predicted DNA-binding transcriptional regulator AlpA